MGFIGVLGIIFGVLFISWGLEDNDSLFLLGGAFEIVVGLVLIGYSIHESKPNKEIQNDKYKNFYYECLNHQLYNLDSTDDMEKAMSLAKRVSLESVDIYNIKQIFKKAKKATREERYTRFYEFCSKKGSKNFDGTFTNQNIVSFAKTQGIIGNQELKKAYNKGKKHFESNAKVAEIRDWQKNKDAAEEIKRNQHNAIIADYDKLIKYSELSGKEKRISMIKAMMAPFEAQLKNINEMEKDRDKMTSYIMNMGIEKEKDWALWGGVAEGIGGLGAGISTALDMQAENVEIRARNERQRAENMDTAVSMYSFQNSMIDDARKENQNTQNKLAPYNAMLNRAKSAIVSNKPGTDAIKELDFGNTKVQISPYGAFSVEVDVTQRNELTVGYDSAVVDGTIAAELYQKGKCVGSALCVLPLKGTESPVTIKGICKGGANPDLPYEVKFKPHKLCIIEKMK